jgi:hypothetical protein
MARRGMWPWARIVGGRPLTACNETNITYLQMCGNVTNVFQVVGVVA